MSRIFRVFVLAAGFVLGVSSIFAEEPKPGTESQKERFVISLDEVLVSAPMQKKVSSSAKPVTILDSEALNMQVGSSIGETLKQVPGVHGQSFGPGVGLPVIRGQSGPRVRVLSNGLGANDASQASPDHASSTIPVLADRVEVLRGPATLLYGSGAIGGVVNVIDNRIPEEVPDSIAEGALQQRFNSVSNETSTAVKIEGGKNYFAYHIDGSYQNRDNVDIGGRAIDVGRARVSEPGLDVTRNTRGFLDNSDSDSFGASGGVSLIGDLGFIGVSGNFTENNYGVPSEGTEDSEFARVELEQDKYDLKGAWNQPIGIIEAIRMRLSFTDYQHEEKVEDEVENRFTNDTYEGRLEIPHNPIAGFTGVVGVQTIASEFAAINVEDNEFLVPRSQINSYAAFAQESFDIGPVEAELGVRVEHVTVDPDEGFTQPSLDFTPVSASASTIWKLNEQNTFNVALTRSQRAPQIQELFFEGFHEASRSFERGNPGLGLETSYNVDLGYKFFSDWVVAELSLFHNWVDDYIFLQRSGMIIDDAPEVIARQAEARFMGYEANLIFPLLNHERGVVDLTLFSDYTRGRLVGRGDVPQMPPLRWGFQIDHALGEWSSSLRLTRGEEQNHPGANESDTPGYVLLNLNTQYRIPDFQGLEVILIAKGNNLLDENIRNSASFLRNFAPEPGRGAEIAVRVNF